MSTFITLSAIIGAVGGIIWLVWQWDVKRAEKAAETRGYHRGLLDGGRIATQNWTAYLESIRAFPEGLHRPARFRNQHIPE